MPLDQQFIFRDHLLIARVDQVIERLVARAATRRFPRSVSIQPCAIEEQTTGRGDNSCFSNKPATV
jgi:hypothetical protein